MFLTGKQERDQRNGGYRCIVEVDSGQIRAAFCSCLDGLLAHFGAPTDP